MTKPFSLDSLLASLGGEATGVEKVASEQAATDSTQAVSTAGKELEDLLTKQANEETPNMANAKETGRKIADNIMALVKVATEKKANDMGNNQVITHTSAQAAQSSAGAAEVPREGQSITQTLQALVANGIANGAVLPENLDRNVAGGGDEANAAPAPMPTADGSNVSAGKAANDEVEKAAAVSELVGAGVDFYTAVAMVKAAEEEIKNEEGEQIKQAAVAALIQEGMDIESAVLLVKQAMQVDPTLGGAQAAPALNEKQAAAVDYLVSQGRSVEDALAILGIGA